MYINEVPSWPINKECVLLKKVFLHAVTARRRKMQVRYQDVQWWMRRRQLPVPLRKRVGHFERQRWATMGGVEDDMELIKDLPEGLRRDIKRHLCLDLIKKVCTFLMASRRYMCLKPNPDHSSPPWLRDPFSVP